MFTLYSAIQIFVLKYDFAFGGGLLVVSYSKFYGKLEDLYLSV